MGKTVTRFLPSSGQKADKKLTPLASNLAKNFRSLSSFFRCGFSLFITSLGWNPRALRRHFFLSLPPSRQSPSPSRIDLNAAMPPAEASNSDSACVDEPLLHVSSLTKPLDEPQPATNSHVTVLLNPVGGNGRALKLFNRVCRPILAAAGFRIDLRQVSLAHMLLRARSRSRSLACFVCFASLAREPVFFFFFFPRPVRFCCYRWEDRSVFFVSFCPASPMPPFSPVCASLIPLYRCPWPIPFLFFASCFFLFLTTH